MSNATIPFSVLNIVVWTAIILGCIYAMCQLIKKYRSVKPIKDSQGKVVGSKKTGSIVKTIFLIFFLIVIMIFAGFIGTLYIFNIILIS